MIKILIATLPEDLPTLVWIAGDNEDKYVKSKKLKEWSTHQSRFTGEVSATQCRGAMHELDNETHRYGGLYVRKETARFIKHNIIGGEFLFKRHQSCHKVR